MYEADIVYHLQFTKQCCTDQTIEIAAGDKSIIERLKRHGKYL
jgi:hypothetical protein